MGELKLKVEDIFGIYSAEKFYTNINTNVIYDLISKKNVLLVGNAFIYIKIP